MPSKIAPPGFLDPRAAEVYEAVYDELARPVTLSNALLLASYAQSQSDYERHTEAIQEGGDTIVDHNGSERRTPIAMSQAKAFDMMTKAAVLLGIGKKAAAAAAPTKRKSKIAAMRMAPRQKKID